MHPCNMIVSQYYSTIHQSIHQSMIIRSEVCTSSINKYHKCDKWRYDQYSYHANNWMYHRMHASMHHDCLAVLLYYPSINQSIHESMIIRSEVCTSSIDKYHKCDKWWYDQYSCHANNWMYHRMNECIHATWLSRSTILLSINQSINQWSSEVKSVPHL